MFFPFLFLLLSLFFVFAAQVKSSRTTELLSNSINSKKNQQQQIIYLYIIPKERTYDHMIAKLPQ